MQQSDIKVGDGDPISTINIVNRRGDNVGSEGTFKRAISQKRGPSLGVPADGCDDGCLPCNEPGDCFSSRLAINLSPLVTNTYRPTTSKQKNIQL